MAEAVLGRTLCAPCWPPGWRRLTTRDVGMAFGLLDVIDWSRVESPRLIVDMHALGSQSYPQ